MDYAKLYNALISFRKSNPLKKSKELYTEKHHIIPRCLGGSDDRGNLVRLTPREHFIAHRLLAKMYPEERGLVLAVVMMLSTREGVKIASSRALARLRLDSSNAQSKSMLNFWQNHPEIKVKYSTNTSKQWANPNFYKMQSTKMRAQSIEQWKSPSYRNDMIDMMSSMSKKWWCSPNYRSQKVAQCELQWQDPSFRKIVIESTKAQWKDPKFREIHVERLNKLWVSEQFRNKMSETMSRTVRGLWSTQEFQQSQSKRMKAMRETTEFRTLMINSREKAWQDPHARQKMSKRIKDMWNSTGFRERMSNSAKQQWDNPDFRKRCIDIQLSKFLPDTFDHDDERHQMWELADVLFHISDGGYIKLTSVELKKRGIECRRVRDFTNPILKRFRNGWNPLEDEHWLMYIDSRCARRPNRDINDHTT